MHLQDHAADKAVRRVEDNAGNAVTSRRWSHFLPANLLTEEMAPDSGDRATVVLSVALPAAIPQGGPLRVYCF